MRFTPALRAIPIVFAALAAASCNSDDTVAPPAKSITLRLSPASATVAPGASVQVTATVIRNNFDGGIGIGLLNTSAGMSASVGGGSTTSLDSATMVLNITSTGIPGTYTMSVIARGSGVTEVTQDFTLTVTAGSAVSSGDARR
jgi:hypothetical protein